MMIATLRVLILAASICAPLAAAAAERVRLTANTVLYVRPDGRNSNSGLADSPEGAWADPQYALNRVLDDLDFSRFDVRIKLAAGRWTPPAAGYICGGRHLGRGNLVIEGAGRDLTVIDGAVNGGAALWISNGCTIGIEHMALASGPATNSLQAIDGALVSFGHVRWEGAKNVHVYVARGGATIEQTGPDVIAGSAEYHVLAAHGGQFRNVGQKTKFVADADFVNYAYASSHGDVTYTYIDPARKPMIMTDGHKVTGRRCLADLTGTVQASGLGADFFPGTIDCLATNGGRIQQ